MLIYQKFTGIILVSINIYMKMYLHVVFLFISFSFTAGNIASIITKCKHDDAKCLKDFTQDLLQELAVGEPSLGIDHLEPIFIQKVDASTPNLKLVLTDVTVKGLKDCVIKKVKRDFQKHKFLFKLACSVNLDGQYQMDGRLLIIPINGNGGVHVSLKKAIVVLETDIAEDTLQDGKKHWVITNFSYNYELKEKSNIHFENLFNGNEILSKAAEGVIKDNGNEIINEVGSPIIKDIIGRVTDVIGQFYHAIPVEDLDL